MLYALSWFLVLGLLALWSLVAWALHAVAVWSVANAGALTGGLVLMAWVYGSEWVMRWVSI